MRGDVGRKRKSEKLSMLRHRNDSVETALVNHCDIFSFSSLHFIYVSFFSLWIFAPKKKTFRNTENSNGTNGERSNWHKPNGNEREIEISQLLLIRFLWPGISFRCHSHPSSPHITAAGYTSSVVVKQKNVVNVNISLNLIGRLELDCALKRCQHRTRSPSPPHNW